MQTFIYYKIIFAVRIDRNISDVPGDERLYFKLIWFHTVELKKSTYGIEALTNFLHYMYDTVNYALQLNSVNTIC